MAQSTMPAVSEDRDQIPCGLTKWLQLKQKTRPARMSFDAVPHLSLERQQASLEDSGLDIEALVQDADSHANKSETVLYLAYGSNLSAETFLGKRQIRPLSQINVVVPSLTLTFDLSGIPYTEPCFGNVRSRDTSTTNPPTKEPPHHKDRWHKGLVGVVYEVTKADYVHIIATEGGGASYKDVLIDCYALPSDPNLPVPDDSQLPPLTSTTATNPRNSFPNHKYPVLKAHTLFAPPSTRRRRRHGTPPKSSDSFTSLFHSPSSLNSSSYAQPSDRYLSLITTGALEHRLPTEYRSYLSQIRPYTITTPRQRLGQFVFLAIWAPIFAFVFSGVGRLFLDKRGRYPGWFARFLAAGFEACWGSYDDVFRGVFGEGERTEGQGTEEGGGEGGEGDEIGEVGEPYLSEKRRLLDVEHGNGEVDYGTNQ